MTSLEEIMLQGVAAMEQMVADNSALNKAWREGTYQEALAKIRERVIHGRDDSGSPASPDASGTDPGPVE